MFSTNLALKQRAVISCLTRHFSQDIITTICIKISTNYSYSYEYIHILFFYACQCLHAHLKVSFCILLIRLWKHTFPLDYRHVHKHTFPIDIDSQREACILFKIMNEFSVCNTLRTIYKVHEHYQSTMQVNINISDASCAIRQYILLTERSSSLLRHQSLLKH